MAFKVFAPGVLTSSDVNTFLMRQAVITCTSSTRPASPSEGMTIYETDTDTLLTYTGAAWSHVLDVGGPETWSLTIESGGSGTDWDIGNGTIDATKMRVGQFWIVQAFIEFGSTSVFGTKSLQIGSCPTARRTISGVQINGSVNFRDSSVGTAWQGLFGMATGTEAILNVGAASGTWVSGDGVTSTVPFSWASGDQVTFTAVYEAA